MSEVAPAAGESAPAVTAAGFSPVVASIFETLLNAIHNGRLTPGEQISDGRLAAEFAVSRTPVREALQRLRELGIVEAVAGRYTRVAIVTPEQTAQAMTVWIALYGALANEVATDVPDEVRDAMANDHAACLEAIRERDFPTIARLNFSFYDHLLQLSNNPILLSGIARVVHLIRLGSLHLPTSIDIGALADAQTRLLAALESSDPAAARDAIERIRQIEIPQE